MGCRGSKADVAGVRPTAEQILYCFEALRRLAPDLLPNVPRYDLSLSLSARPALLGTVKAHLTHVEAVILLHSNLCRRLAAARAASVSLSAAYGFYLDGSHVSCVAKMKEFASLLADLPGGAEEQVVGWSMGVGWAVVHELQSMKALMERVEIELERLASEVEFAVTAEDEVAVKVVMDGVGDKVTVVEGRLEHLGEYVQSCAVEIRDAVDGFLHCHLSTVRNGRKL